MRGQFVKIGIILVLGAVLSGCNRQTSLDQDLSLNMSPPPTTTPTPMPTVMPTPTAAPATASATKASNMVEIATKVGKIKIKLMPEYAPKTVENFLTKVNSGFYQGLTFHRVEDWVIQGGDPEGTGRGGGTMATELSSAPFKTGSVGVARGGDIKISNDAQFFICIEDCSWLTGQYTIFGEVISGLDVAKQITVGTKIDQVISVDD